MNSKLVAFYELIRPLNVLITFLSIGAACILAGGRGDIWVSIIVASGAGALIAAGANIINDYFDIAIDRINKPNRPLPRGDISAREAWLSWLLVSFIGILLNVFLNSLAFGIAIVAVVSLYAYSAVLKRTVLVGNLLVSGMTALAFIYGGVVVENVRNAWMPAVFAFLINLAREVIKDIEDIEGDRQEGARTFPIECGVLPSVILASGILIALVVSTIIPFMLRLYGMAYQVLVVIIDVSLLYSIYSLWKDATAKNLSRLSMVLKVNMIIGLCAIFLGSV